MNMTTARTPTPTKVHIKLLSPETPWLIKKLVDWFSAPGSFENTPGFTEIQYLANSLSNLDDVKQVRAVACRPGDLHNVTFELLVDVNADDELDDVGCLWEEAERQAFRVHRDLRKTTGEEWHFNAELVREFESIDSERLITAGHGG
jgi:hypothetical protein